MATFIKYQDELQQKGLTATSTASRLTSTICRIVNVVFSEQFVDEFLSVNDRMSRRDHETKKHTNHSGSMQLLRTILVLTVNLTW